MYFKERELYETALGKMFHDLNFKPNYFVTLTFRNPTLSESGRHQNLFEISEKRAKASLKKFIIKLNIELFGRRSKKALKMACFIEGGDIKNRHFHILVQVPDDYLDDHINQFKDILIDCWLKSEPKAGNPIVDKSGKDDWFSQIPADEYADFIAYSLKELRYGAEPFLPELSNFSGRKITE